MPDTEPNSSSNTEVEAGGKKKKFAKIEREWKLETEETEISHKEKEKGPKGRRRVRTRETKRYYKRDTPSCVIL
jgi:hypothetical protein